MDKLFGKTKERERVIVDQIGPALARAARDHTKELTTLNALMTLGAKHLPVAEMLKQLHPPTEVQSQLAETDTRFADEVIELLVENKPVSDELADALLTETLITAAMAGSLSGALEDRQRIERLIRELTKSMTDEEREEYHTLFMEGSRAKDLAFLGDLSRMKGITG